MSSEVYFYIGIIVSVYMFVSCCIFSCFCIAVDMIRTNISHPILSVLEQVYPYRSSASQCNNHFTTLRQESQQYLLHSYLQCPQAIVLYHVSGFISPFS